MKILIQLNNQIKFSNWDIRFKEVKEFYAKAGIDLTFFIQNSDLKDVPFIPEQNYKIIDPKWFNKNISQPAKLAGFDGVIFLMSKFYWMGAPADAVRIDTIPNFIEIMGGFNEKEGYGFNNVFYQGDKCTHIMKHELAHEFYAMKGKPDMTHYWYLQGTPDKIIEDLRPKTLIDKTIALFTPTSPATAILTRKSDDGVQTLGTLVYRKGNTIFECKTLELAWKENKRNISCIPKGEYQCKLGYSPSFKKILYEVTNVKDRLGILIHVGNYNTDIKGCILVGNGYKDINGDKRVDIIQSTVTLKKLMDSTYGDPFKLIIR